jgi:amino acid transporter
MAEQGALPPVFGKVHPRFKTPYVGTVVFTGIGVAYYVAFTILSPSFLTDSLTALGPIVALYYLANGLSCVVYFRRDLFKSVRTALLAGVGPGIASCVLMYACIKQGIDLGHSSSSDTGTTWFGLGRPLVITIGILLVGALLMLGSRSRSPAFFRRRPERGSLEPVFEPGDFGSRLETVDVT